MGVVESGLGTETNDIRGNLETKEVIGQEAVQDPDIRGACLGYLNEEAIRDSIRVITRFIGIFSTIAWVYLMSAMHDCQIVHFSCHGSTSAVDPSQSELLLND